MSAAARPQGACRACQSRNMAHWVAGGSAGRGSCGAGPRPGVPRLGAAVAAAAGVQAAVPGAYWATAAVLRHSGGSFSPSRHCPWLCRAAPQAAAMVQIGRKAGPKAAKRKALTFTIDCSKPVEDKIMEIASFEKFLLDKIKVDGKTGACTVAAAVGRRSGSSAVGRGGSVGCRCIGTVVLGVGLRRNILALCAPGGGLCWAARSNALLTRNGGAVSAAEAGKAAAY